MNEKLTHACKGLMVMIIKKLIMRKILLIYTLPIIFNLLNYLEHTKNSGSDTVIPYSEL